MSLNDAANILSGFMGGSKDVAETVLRNAGYTPDQLDGARSGCYIGEPLGNKV
jgi:hypothetical protein